MNSMPLWDVVYGFNPGNMRYVSTVDHADGCAGQQAGNVSALKYLES